MKQILALLILFAVAAIEISCSNKPNIALKPAVITQAESLPGGRGGHAAGILNEHVFVVGGTDWSIDHTEKFWLNDSIFFDGNIWQNGPSLPFPIAYSMFAADDTGIYLAGGTDGSANLKTVYHLASLSDSWRTLAPLPVGMASGSGAILNGKLYAACGWMEQGISSQMWALNVNQPDANWLPCQTLPGPKRAFPALAACGDYLYLFGGMSPDPNNKDDSLGVMNDAYRYDPQQDSWLKLKDLPWKGYGWSASSTDDNHILLTGKADGNISKDIYLIDVRNMNTEKIGETIIQTTTAPLIKVKSNEYWLIAGEPDSNKNRTKIITSIKFKN